MHRALFRRGVRICLCWLLTLPVISLPAANLSPVGTLRSEGNVFLGGDPARTESAVYPGDEVRTEEGRATVSLARGTLVTGGKNSSAIVRRSEGSLVIALAKGQLAVSFAEGMPSRVEADGLNLSPSGSFPTLAEVAMRGDGSLIVAVKRGKLSIADLRADPVSIVAGQVITISPRPAQAPESKPVGTAAHGKMTLGEKLRTFKIGGLSHAASVDVVVGVAAAAAVTGVVVPLAVQDQESPSTP